MCDHRHRLCPVQTTCGCAGRGLAQAIDQKETPVQNPFKGCALCRGSLQQRSKRRRGRYHPGDTSLGGLPRSQDGERAEVSAGSWVGPSLRVSERRVFGSLRAGPFRPLSRSPTNTSALSLRSLEDLEPPKRQQQWREG